MNNMRKIVWVLVFISAILWALPDKTIAGSFTYSDLLYAIAFIIIVFENLVFKKPLFILLNKRYSVIFYILLFTGIGAMTGMMRSKDTMGASVAFLQYVFIFVVVLSVIHYLINNNMKNALKVLVVFTIPGIISGVMVSLSGLGIVTAYDSQLLYGLGRYRGFNGSLPTAYGAQTVLTCVIIYMMLRISKRIIVKLFWFTMLLVCVYAIILTASFGAIIMLGLAIAFIWGFFSKHILLTRSLLVIMICVGVSVFYSHQAGNYQYLNYLPDIIKVRVVAADGEFGSVGLRSELNRLGIEQFFGNPLMGIGHTQFMYNNPYGLVVHNTMISAAVESGIFGLIGVMLYLIVPIVLAYRLIKSNLFHSKSYEGLMVKYLFVYLLIRLAQTTTSHEYILRELWLPGLVLIVIYATQMKRKRKCV